ncbi:MAG: type II toxin-antitoxin system prevent-host-death family antitoxin [Steroidobacteraceae bacterium]|nr:type II toxin-antitoxin system prevent-host-death family antitoxin [Steroidobacteraceae bacterium]
MEKATVSRLKNNLSAYLRKVRAGHPVVIYDRDLPIARIERIEAAGRGADRLALLRAQGLVRPPTRRATLRQLATHAAPVPEGARLLDALRSDRDDDR